MELQGKVTQMEEKISLAEQEKQRIQKVIKCMYVYIYVCRETITDMLKLKISLKSSRD